MKEVIGYITSNKEFFTIIVSFFSISIPFIQFLNTKNEEQKQKNQDNFYERILKKLTNQKGDVGLEEQVAILFDLRNYPQYYPVTKRILKNSIKRWEEESKKHHYYSCLVTEANETLRYINANFIGRMFYKK